MLLVGESAQHLALVEFLGRIAPAHVEVLVVGPTGVGKELYARYLHEHSGCSGQFVAVNCGAVPAALFENELFGHVSGAFTGARAQHEGVVAAAEDGTLFLDEVDSLSLENQAKILRFLQEREYRRLGETRVRRTNTRIVAATNVDLAQLVRLGRFRSDLYFRLRVVPVVVPPLRERRDDVVPLVKAFADRYARTYKRDRLEFRADALAWLEEYSWPGNVRELENCVRYLAATKVGRVVTMTDVVFLRGTNREPGPPQTVMRLDLSFQRAKRELVDEFERQYIAHALRNSGGNISQAARASGKARRAFFELMRKHGLCSHADQAPAADLDQGLESAPAANSHDLERISSVASTIAK